MKISKENQELSDKIMAGVRKAVNELIVKTAKENGELVIADKDGTVKRVLAKDLL